MAAHWAELIYGLAAQVIEGWEPACFNSMLSVAMVSSNEGWAVGGNVFLHYTRAARATLLPNKIYLPIIQQGDSACF